MSINKKLLRYSYPCAEILYKTGKLEKDELELYRDAIKGGKEFPVEKYKDKFSKVSEFIDPENTSDDKVVEYFFGKHNREKHEFCHVVKSKVAKEEGENVFLSSIEEPVEYITEKPKKGDVVVLHLGKIVDIIK